ncbi:MAG: twin-arginine translocation pathway signal protein [Alphaproteobacteria bacterium]|jgi:lipid-binding SYLF domain-containing protein|nr:twin-arginine translocation pathway signal protein [Alphaproteobacteria bacterium]
MILARLPLLAALLLALVLAAGCASTPGGFDESEVAADSRRALARLTANNRAARAIAAQAHSVVVFPSIVKGGLVVGGAYGEGAHLRGGAVQDYYTSLSGSWGLQAGAQSHGYALFLMDAGAADYLSRSGGWEIGVGPTVVVVDAGKAENLSTSTLREDAYAFIFNQRGLMAGVSIEGTKITRVR